MNFIRKIQQRSALRHSKGFTLLEVLLVVAIISILAGIVILAINPSKQLGDTRNASRRADVNTILNATYQYAIDNNGIPATITVTPTEVCRSAPPATFTCTGLIDLSVLTTNGKYLVALPNDPSGPNTNGTKYSISKDVNNRVTVTATTTDNGATISATR